MSEAQADEPVPSLDDLRRRIDEVDLEIVRLLNQRTLAAVRIGKLKAEGSQAVYVPAREKEVLRRVTEFSEGPLEAKHLRAIYREIMSAAISLEHNVKVSFLGPMSTYSHQAALSRFGNSVEYILCENITEVFLAVEKGAAQYGVVPIENSIEGGVTATQDLLVNSALKICAELYLPIANHLLARHDPGEITRIYSHPQPFAQCRNWLERNYPGVELVTASSTARAAELAADEPGSAAIASSLAAELHRLEILASNIQDVGGNTTRFLVLGHNYGRPTGDDKTSLYFGVQHKVGALMHAMEPFRQREINLLKIESRPSKSKAWEYVFFVDIEGHARDENVDHALREVSAHCNVLQVLGSYPRVSM